MARFVFAYNYDVGQPIFIIFGRHIMQEICNKAVYNLPALHGFHNCTIL